MPTRLCSTLTARGFRNRNGEGSDNLKETIEANYKRIKKEILSLVESEKDLFRRFPNIGSAASVTRRTPDERDIFLFHYHLASAYDVNACGQPVACGVV